MRRSASREQIHARPEPSEAQPTHWSLGRRELRKRWPAVVVATSGLLLLVLLAAQPGASIGQRGHNAATFARARFTQATHRPGVSSSRLGPAALPRATKQTCHPGSGAKGYVNPLAAATVTPRRIDQGVDYGGSGALTAIGEARVLQILLSDTGWPGAFIEYRLRSGPEAGCAVFYAEGVKPAAGLFVGEIIHAGQAVATIDPENSDGIEIGWASGVGTGTYAARMGQWSTSADEDNIPTPAGKSFSGLVAALGGPPGLVKR